MIQEVYQGSSSASDNEPSFPAHIDLSQYIPPPNPITTKTLEEQQPQNLQKSRKRQGYRSSKLLQLQCIESEELSLQNFYDKDFLIFQKFQNRHHKERKGVKYASSLFYDNIETYWECSKYIGMLRTDQSFEFDSNYQSANLFQVYKIGENQFDLILQNDLNTTGYAQWFNFKVKNKHKNQSIKLNIMNMYKSSSLYQKGMKPLASSMKEGKKWQRNTHQVQYYENDIPTERQPNKFYHTLSFCYDFKFDADEVQFCHFFPYTSIDCQNFLENINGSSKIRIKNLGNSSLRKPIPLIQIFSDTSNMPQKSKKAIVIIGRQHSGETQSSFLIQEIVSTLLTNSNQSQFLLEKFDIYICPMINIDGVFLGNYRTNSYGYDLNRYWHTDNQLKIPQVFYFKKFINNLKKRNKISLILDLHGHSKKYFFLHKKRLNSFFYGNPYGKNYMMLPFVASKLCEMIKFESCTFVQEKSEKSKTARAVLGTLLKDTTYIYTYEVSFWGYKKNNRVVPYTLENLKQLSKALVLSIYKVFMEEIKEEVSLKQSVFFKEITKQLSVLTQNYFEKQSGSDSEAENLTVKEDFQRVSVAIKTEKQTNHSLKINETYAKSRDVSIQVDQSVLEDSNYQSSNKLKFISNQQYPPVEKIESQTQRKDYELSSKVSLIPGAKSYRSSKTKELFLSRQSKKKQERALYHLAYDNNFQTKQNFYYQSPQNANQMNSSSRKQFLLQKLRIFGQTFSQNFQPQPKHKTKTLKNVGNQVPQIIEPESKSYVNQIVLRNKSFSLGNRGNQSGKHLQKVYNHNNKHSWQKSNKQSKKPFSKKKNFSVVLKKPAVENVISLNQRSHQKFELDPQIQKSNNPFMIRISKSPLVRIQKITSVNTMIGNQLKQRQSIYRNINRLKSNITALKREGSDKLPEIQGFHNSAIFQ